MARAADGTLFVCTSVEFEAVDTAAFRWWFAEGCPGADEYKRWHPRDHVSASWYKKPDEGTQTECVADADHAEEVDEAVDGAEVGHAEEAEAAGAEAVGAGAGRAGAGRAEPCMGKG